MYWHAALRQPRCDYASAPSAPSGMGSGPSSMKFLPNAFCLVSPGGGAQTFSRHCVRSKALQAARERVRVGGLVGGLVGGRLVESCTWRPLDRLLESTILSRA